MDYALELSLAATDDAVVRAQWECLRAAGLPSQADHRSMTNAPHVSLVTAVAIESAVRDRAVELVRPLLPAALAVRGLLLLGEGPRVTVAHLVEPGPALAEATTTLRAVVPGVRHPVWTPHLTLARRVPRQQLPRAVAALADGPSVRQVQATRLRWWDPRRKTVDDLVTAPA